VLRGGIYPFIHDGTGLGVQPRAGTVFLLHNLLHAGSLFSFLMFYLLVFR
jgi:hypothetical protein